MGLSGLGNVIKLREMVNNQKVPLSFSSKLLSRLFARLGCSNCKKHPNKANVLCLGALIFHSFNQDCSVWNKVER